MAFVNQSSAANFVPQKIKVLKVLCQECFQEMGTTPLAITLPTVITPADLALLEITVTPGTPTVTNFTVLTNKVVNSIAVPLTVTVVLLGVTLATITLPGVGALVTGEINCPGVVPDGTVNVQKHDLEVLQPITPVIVSLDATGLILNLAITVIVEGCAVVSKEEILKVNAASLFCSCS